MADIIHPKVLIISDCDFHHGKDATAITVRNIFDKWPSERLSFIQLMSYNNSLSTVSGKFILDSQHLKYGNLLMKIRKNQSKVTNDTPALIVEKNSNKKQKLKHVFRIGLAASADMLSYKISSELIEFIEKEKPEIIYVLPYGRRIIKLALDIHRRFNIPLLPHFMDDWPSTIYNDSTITSLQRKFTLKSLNNLLKVSEKSLVISDAMKKEFKKRYKKSQFFSLMNDVEEYAAKDIDLEYITKNKLSLCYAGGLHLNRWTSLLTICNLMQKMDRIERLDIYTSERDWQEIKEYFKKFHFIKYKGFIDQKKVLDTLNNYDCLVFIESFDENIKKYTKFSISTKIPEYLSLGKPIIAIGPSDIASINYLNENNLAIVCNNTNEDECKAILKEDLSNTKMLRKKIDNGKIIFFKNHYRKVQHEKFLEILSSLLNY